MSENIVVSFCIATYQRYELLRELILEILSVPSDEFEIVVCDDRSKDNSVEKLRTIQDSRLHIYINDENVGSLQNIYESLSLGEGKYLFYLNDRDNVDPFKIEQLILLLKKVENENVAFIQCVDDWKSTEKYQVYQSGKDAFIEFSCKIVHPTGFIFQKNVWKRIKNCKKIFENQNYGDYPLTIVCAIMALHYNGAKLYGNICDVERERIDFSKIKSGYYKNRKDKRLWYTPGVQWRELMIAYHIMQKLNIKEDTMDTLFCNRYSEGLERITIKYEELVKQPSNTLHYNLEMPSSILKINITAIKNGIYLWKQMRKFCKVYDKSELLNKINTITKLNYITYFKNIYEKVLRYL